MHIYQYWPVYAKSISGNTQGLITKEGTLLGPKDKENQCSGNMQTDFTTERILC